MIEWRLLVAGSVMSALSLAVLLLAGPDGDDAGLVALGAALAFPLALALAAVVLVRRNRRAMPPRRHEGWEAFEHELARSRRHEHPFVLIRIPPHATRLVSGGHVTGDPRSRQVAPAVAAFLRRIDVVWTDDEGTWVLLPESGRATGEAMLDRLRLTAPALVPDLGVRVAVFPEDGLTRAALVEHMLASGTVSGRARTAAATAVSSESDAELTLDGRVG